MRILFCVLAALLVLPGAASPGEVEYYFLKIEGSYLNSAALNGQIVYNGAEVPVLPYYVTPYLKDGRNELLVEYTSHATYGLTVVIEARTVGPRKTEVVRFSGAPGETGGKRVSKTVAFSVHLPPPGTPMRLTEGDQKEISALLRAYYDTLVRRDAEGLRKFYERAMNEDGQIYPEGPEFYRQWIVDASVRMMGSPQFRMKPFQPAGLLLNAGPQVVVVIRADHSPILESDPVDIQVPDVTTASSQTSRGTAMIHMRVAPIFVLFKKYNGIWSFTTLPVGF